MINILIGIFGILVALAVLGRTPLLSGIGDPEVTPKMAEGKVRDTLYVLVHGLDKGKNWNEIVPALKHHGDVLTLKYDASFYSNVSMMTLARNIDIAVQEHHRANHERVILIGQSLGALLIRRAYLMADEDRQEWSKCVKRVVLVAGMNRGWDISGKKPSDMQPWRWAFIWFASWAGRLTGTGKLLLDAETGAPFIANLRLDWMKRMREERNSDLEFVQLLGDIDDLVSDEDNKDLQSMTSPNFAWIRVRGTGHGDIADFRDETTFGDIKLGEYRKAKYLLATTEADFDKVKQENEEQAFRTDNDVTHIIFVLHGIRDLGRWAAAFEQELLEKFRNSDRSSNEVVHAAAADGKAVVVNGKLAVASIRYGYFGMGPFLFRPGRQKYVNWFMDEYTETLARYPRAEEIHFVGHSNGTYLLGSALKKYEALQVDRVALGGSVLPRGFEWSKIRGGAKWVRNYIAPDDWVVALFPRFFEPRFVQRVIHNDIGSAGFNGFDLTQTEESAGNGREVHVENIRVHGGGHGAFLNEGKIEEIADFILSPHPPAGNSEASANTFFSKLSSWGSAWGTWFIVWPFLGSLIIFTGWFVVTSASEPRWPFFAGYVLLMLAILTKA